MFVILNCLVFDLLSSKYGHKPAAEPGLLPADLPLDWSLFLGVLLLWEVWE